MTVTPLAVIVLAVKLFASGHTKGKPKLFSFMLLNSSIYYYSTGTGSQALMKFIIPP